MEDAFSGLGNGTKFDNKVLQTSHSTVGHLSTKLRLVRCPKCRQLLQESANVPVYKCGGCYTVLRAKKHKNDQDKCFLKHNNGGDPNEYAQSNGKYIGGANLLDEVASPTEPNHHKSAESEVDKSGNCLEEELRLVTVKMPHWQPKDPEQRYAISRRPLVESMNQHSVSQLPNKAPESFAEWNAKKCEGRNKGRKKSRKAKVETGFPSPPSSKSIVLHRRPGYGQMVSECLVKANHFLAEISKRDLTQCSVTIEPEVGSTKLNIAIMTQLVKLHRDTDLGKRLPVYDGRKAFYTAGVLPFTSKEFTIQLAEEDEGLGIIREREFKVTIKFAARAGMHQLHELISGKQIDTSLEARKIIAIVLKQLACQRYVSVGRFFYSSNIKRPQLLGNGLQSWRGFYQSLKPTQMGLSLNIDMSATAFIEPLPVIEFVAQVLGKDVYSRPLSDADCVKVKKALRGVKFEVTHRGNMRRKYRISGLTSLPTSELIFPVDEEKNMKSVIDYFQEVYGFTIRHSHLPCLLVGSARKVNYLPMEACKIVEGQRYSKRLNDKQITSLLKLSCQRPKEQEAEILQSAIGLLYGGHILCLSETKIVRKTLKGKCRSMSVLSLEDHIQHVDRRWEDAAKSHGAKRIYRQLVIHRLSTAKHIRKQHGIHRWPFQRPAISLPDRGHILSISEKKIVRKTLKRKCRSMSVLSLVDRQQHVDRRWEDAAKNIGAKRICRQLVIHRVSIAKRICRQHGIHHRWPFERDRATEKGYSLGDEIPVEVINLSTHAELVSRLQLIYISWLGRFSPQPSAIPRGGLIAGPIALSSSEFAATNNIAQRVRQDQKGSGASGSENERTREQKDPKEKRKSITIDDLLVFQGKKTREEVAEILCVSLTTVKRTWTTSGRGTWKNGGRKKVLRPPDQHGEGNTSTACETPSHNVQTGMEGEPVGENAGSSSGRASQVNDQSTLSTPYPNHDALVFPPPQMTSLPSENWGGSIDLMNSVASQAEPFSDGHISGFSNFATCSDQAAPSQHVGGQAMQSTDHNAFVFPQTQMVSPQEPFLDFTEGSIPLNTENGLIIGSSFGWASRVNDQSTLSTPYPNHDALVFPPPQMTSLPSENRGCSIDLMNSVASQAEPFSDRHISGFSNFATSSDHAAPSQHVGGQAMQSTDHNAFVFRQTQMVSPQEPFPAGHVFEFSNWNKHTNSVKIKAFYGEDIYKFLFPLTSGINDLKKEVSKRLNVEVERFVVKYMDEHGDLISLPCDEDWMLCLESTRGNDEIRVSVHDKVGGTPNFCERCRSSTQTRA